MSTTTHEVGRVSDRAELHAVRRSISDPVAVCGAGRIVTVIAGRFDPTDPSACTACRAHVA